MTCKYRDNSVIYFMGDTMQFHSDTMTIHQEQGVTFLRYKMLSKIGFIHHAFSTKLGEGSSSHYPMNLSFEHDDHDAVTENYRLFCRAAGFDYRTLVGSSQDHHTFVRVVTSADRGINIYRAKDIESVDALVTIEPGVTLCTYYADCTPIFFVDTATHAIGLAHAGWRGTVARIAERVIDTMQERFGTDPSDLVCAIGPNINKCCYEVDQPVADEFYALGLDNSVIVYPKDDGKYMIDMLECNRQILVRRGVPAERITISDLCTKCRSDLLWSHRATAGKRGTMAAFLCINKV